MDPIALIALIALFLGVPTFLAYWQYKKTGVTPVIPIVTPIIPYDGKLQLQMAAITGPNVYRSTIQGQAHLQFMLQQLKIAGAQIYELDITDVDTITNPVNEDRWDGRRHYYKVVFDKQEVIIELVVTKEDLKRYESDVDFSSWADEKGFIEMVHELKLLVDLNACDAECRLTIVDQIKVAMMQSALTYKVPDVPKSEAAFYYELTAGPMGNLTPAKINFRNEGLPNIDLAYANTHIKLGSRIFLPPMRVGIEAVIAELEAGHNVGILGEMRAGKTTLTRYIVGLLSQAGHNCFRLDYQALASSGMGPAQFKSIVNQHFPDRSKRLIFFVDESMDMLTSDSKALPTILDILDGFAQDQLKSATLLSINTDQEKLDPRVLQPGRVSNTVEIKPLTEKQAHRLLQVKPTDMVINEDKLKELFTKKGGVNLGDIYNDILTPKPAISKAHSLLVQYQATNNVQVV